MILSITIKVIEVTIQKNDYSLLIDSFHIFYIDEDLIKKF